MARLHQVSGPLALTALAVTSTLSLAVPGMAQTNSARTALPDSYAAAMKCFVANGQARGMKIDVGDTAGAARYEAGARASFDAANVIGVALGYSRARIETSYADYRERELPRMISNPAYFAEVVTSCRALGLMPQA